MQNIFPLLMGVHSFCSTTSYSSSLICNFLNQRLVLKKIIKNQSLNQKIQNPLEMMQNSGINTVLAKTGHVG